MIHTAVPLTLILAAAPGVTTEAADYAAIRAARADSNAGLASHDIARATAPLLPNAMVLGSVGGLVPDKVAMAAGFAKAFADPTFISFERRPVRIELGGAVAAEHGRWVGRWRQAKGEKRVEGTYLARWRKIDGAWRIASEMFIPLRCTRRNSPFSC